MDPSKTKILLMAAGLAALVALAAYAVGDGDAARAAVFAGLAALVLPIIFYEIVREVVGK